jgi:tRNA dimethylallyltransferase
MDKKILIVIVGPTGIGKTNLSIALAKHYNTEIISSDSRQIYKELSIGTATPEPHQLNTVNHCLIHSLSIHDYYNASMFEQDALIHLKKIYKHNQIAILVGGSMLYVDTLCRGIDNLPTTPKSIREQIQQRLSEMGLDALKAELQHIDPDYCETADLKNPKRITRALEVFYTTGEPVSKFRTNTKQERDFEVIKIGLDAPRNLLYERINQRVDLMIELGLEEEARGVYPFKHLNALNTVGYKELFEYFDGEISRNEAIEKIKSNTRNYARKQLTWFRKDTEIQWFTINQENEIMNWIENQIQIRQQ